MSTTSLPVHTGALGAGMASYHGPAGTADRVATVRLTAVARPVAATAWLAGEPSTTVSS